MCPRDRIKLTYLDSASQGQAGFVGQTLFGQTLNCRPGAFSGLAFGPDVCSQLTHNRAVDGEPAVPLNPAFPLLKVHRVPAQVPVDDRVAPSMKVEPLLLDGCRRQHVWPE